MIRLEQVTKIFGCRAAVDALDLHVPAGEIYGLLGHNGAGKSTAIGMMLGQVWPTAGRIKIRGRDVFADRWGALGRVGAIFESPAFYDYLSGYRNLEIFASYTAPTPRKRLLEILDWVGLSGREKSKVRTYSHGMRARLALAQTLLPDPELLILDEPSDGLDPEGIHEMRRTILRLHCELKVTILLSSHFLNEVEQTCTRIAVLKQGRKVFEGGMRQIRRRDRWLRVRTSDFKAAVGGLTEAGLAAAGTGEGMIVLADGVGPEAVARFLVERGMPVYELSPAEQTLENFYLALMDAAQNQPSG